MENNTRELYIAELKKAGYQASDEHGVVYAYVPDPAEIECAVAETNKIAKETGYVNSRGVIVKAGTHHNAEIGEEAMSA